ncbi:MAG: bifunctional tetrahydrofolate synthase/dihydrofolate synthase, partial [Gammaproteobacteria bacterium]|nr:bifunctional tetrahydrofolate synthase/dihydrofolate synthase [Gammaproteobacteria bacterium]
IADRFPVSYDAVTTTMKDFHLMGRFQIEQRDIPYILDVAHNRQAAELLVANLQKIPKTGLTHCIVGMLKDKNHELIFQELGKNVDSWYVADLDSERAAKADLLKEKLIETVNPEQIYDFEDINMAFEQVKRQAKTGDLVLITGSFLTVRAGILWLENNK